MHQRDYIGFIVTAHPNKPIHLNLTLGLAVFIVILTNAERTSNFIDCPVDSD